jgi:hypothetical protein
MPQVPGFVQTIEKIKKLHISKNDDYAKDSNPFYNFDTTLFILAQFKADKDKVFVWPIANKLARLANLLGSDKDPNHESVIDSLDDIATYVILWKCDIMRREKK